MLSTLITKRRWRRFVMPRSQRRLWESHAEGAALSISEAIAYAQRVHSPMKLPTTPRRRTCGEDRPHAGHGVVSPIRVGGGGHGPQAWAALAGRAEIAPLSSPAHPRLAIPATAPWRWMCGCVCIRGRTARSAALWSRISAIWLGMQWISVRTMWLAPRGDGRGARRGRSAFRRQRPVGRRL